jgi:hypothetical protein
MTATRYYFNDDGPMCKDCYERRWESGREDEEKLNDLKQLEG